MQLSDSFDQKHLRLTFGNQSLLTWSTRTVEGGEMLRAPSAGGDVTQRTKRNALSSSAAGIGEKEAKEGA